MSLEQTSESRDTQSSRILDDYLSRGELAAELGISVRTLARLDAARAGPPRMLWAGRVIYHRDKAREWFQSRLIAKGQVKAWRYG